jgi:hypothetical protein
MRNLIVTTFRVSQDCRLIAAGKMLDGVKDENVLWEQQRQSSAPTGITQGVFMEEDVFF